MCWTPYISTLFKPLFLLVFMCALLHYLPPCEGGWPPGTSLFDAIASSLRPADPREHSPKPREKKTPRACGSAARIADRFCAPTPSNGEGNRPASNSANDPNIPNVRSLPFRPKSERT